MNIDIKSILIFLFITLSVSLSFRVNQANEKLFQSVIQVKKLEREPSTSKSQLEFMQEAHAFSPCNMPVIEGLINLAATNDWVFIT